MSSPEPARRRPTLRRDLFVLLLAVIGVIIGSALVLSGRKSQLTPPVRQATRSTTSVAAALLPDLGSVENRAAALALIRTLDPRTLQPPTSTSVAPHPKPPAGVDLSSAGVQRCTVAIQQQSTDRSLGDRLSERRLMIAGTPTFVLAYALPASGADPNGVRIIVDDARTCRILTAIDR